MPHGARFSLFAVIDGFVVFVGLHILYGFMFVIELDAKIMQK